MTIALSTPQLLATLLPDLIVYCLLSEERNPVRKNPQSILVLGLLEPRFPHTPRNLLELYLDHCLNVCTPYLITTGNWIMDEFQCYIQIIFFVIVHLFTAAYEPLDIGGDGLSVKRF